MVEEANSIPPTTHGTDVPPPTLQLVSTQQVWQLSLVLCLTLLYAGVEWWGSGHTHSVALLADAGHMLADASGLILALLGSVGSVLAQQADAHQTAKRIERVATVLNAIGLLALSVYLWWTGIEQLAHPKPIESLGLLQLAVGGFAVNLIAVWILHGGQQHNLNVKGAYLHVLFDLVGSLAAIVSAVSIMTWHVYWIDPLLSLIVALLVSITSWQFIRLIAQPNAENPHHHHGCGHHHH